MEILTGDIVRLKKKHPCGSFDWEVLRSGADFRLKCCGCEHQVMMARKLVEKNIRRLERNGEEMKMSKRLGNATTINELCDKVGVDAARYFFVQRALDSHLDFDIELATKKSNENPVYYAQYAHARMCSIQKQAQDIELATSFEDLTNEKEIELMKSLQEFNKVIVETAQSRQVHKMCHYIQNLASKFHSFYNVCKVVDRDNLELSSQRLALVKATQIVLANALECIGVEAVESM